MRLDDLGDVRPAAVADFHGLAADRKSGGASSLMEVFADELEELYANPGS